MPSSTLLGSISESVTQFANIISKTIDTDVLIVDNNFNVIGETNRYFVQHSLVSTYTIVGQVIVNQQKMIIPNKSEYPICQNCKDFGKCQIAGFIGVPLFYDDRVIGAIALILPKHRIKNIFQDVDSSIAFINNMAEDLVGRIQKKQEFNELNQVIKEREQILDMLSDAVVLTDNIGSIKYHNKAFQSIFQRNNDFIGEEIQNMIPHKIIYDYFETRHEYENQKVLIEIGSQSFYGFVSCRGIQYAGNKIGVVFAFKTIIDVMQNARAAEKGSMITLQWLKDWLIPGDVLDKAKALAITNEMILIKGKTENLNEILAKGICNYSNRNLQGLTPIYCDSIYREHLDHFLFDEFGEIQKSDHGTIFFKNIEDMPFYLQKRLLYFLKYGEIRYKNIKRFKSDIRFIFSTTADLEKLVEKGLFLEELYYRITENVIEIPALQNSKTLRNMISSGVEFYKRRYEKEEVTVSEEALEFLSAYHWNEDTSKIDIVLEQIVLRYKGNVSVDELYALGLVQNEKEVTIQTISEIEKDKIRHLLNEGYSKTKISNLLGISRATLYRKLEEYQLY